MRRSPPRRRIGRICAPRRSGFWPGGPSVDIVDVVDDAGDWITARRVLAELTAAHLHDELDYELVWADGMRIDPTAGYAVGDRRRRSGG